MKQLHQTEINNFFDITKIITLFTDWLSPDRACAEELHDFWQLIYMYEGERTICIEDIPYRLISGQVLFYPPNIPHKSLENLNKECKIGMISFVCPSSSMDFFRHKVFTLKPKEKNIILNILERGSSIFKFFDGEYGQRGMYAVNTISPAQLYRLKLDIEMFLVCLYSEYHTTMSVLDVETAKKRNQNKEIIVSILEYMEQNLQSNLTVEQISKACDLSVSTIKKIFKEETGNGIIHYFNNLKMKKAMDLIQNSSLSFSQISEELGFSSPFYFSRMFKKMIGASPMEYSKSTNRTN